MKKRTVKSFKQWYDEDSEDINRKPKDLNKKKSIRKESALKRADVDAYIEEDDEGAW